MAHIPTIVFTKAIVASVVTLIIAFLGFTVCSFFGWDTTPISYVAPFIGMWYAVTIGDFSLDTARRGNGNGFIANASDATVVVVLGIMNLIVFFIITGFAMPHLFGYAFSPRPYYGISYSGFMIMYAAVWIIYAVLRVRILSKYRYQTF